MKKFKDLKIGDIVYCASNVKGMFIVTKREVTSVNTVNKNTIFYSEDDNEIKTVTTVNSESSSEETFSGKFFMNKEEMFNYLNKSL